MKTFLNNHLFFTFGCESDTSNDYTVRVMSEEIVQKIYNLVELAKKTGKIAKGANETTKAIERGHAKLVVYAEDVSPKEILMHVPMLCKEKNIPYATVASRNDLGAAVGLKVSTAAVAVLDSGKGDLAEVLSLLDNN